MGVFLGISIHVLRVEDDPRPHYRHPAELHFNPRPPCGGRLVGQFHAQALQQISIHVLRVEDDPAVIYALYVVLISIHVLRVEDDFTGRYSAKIG